MAKMSMSTQN